MIRKLLLLVGLSVLLSASSASAATIVLLSSTGTLATPNSIFEQSFVYDPLTMGSTLVIQSYGYGGSSNAPGGTNATGTIISPGGFDPIVGLFSGGDGANGPLVGSNDDGSCGPGMGATHNGICFDSRLVFNGLAAGTYTLALTVFPNFPPATESGAYGSGSANFNQRTNAFAVDVVAPNATAAVPEPASMMLLGLGLAGMGARRWRQRKS